MPDRPQKITFAQMRNSGVRGILVYCSDYKCSHSIARSAPIGGPVCDYNLRKEESPIMKGSKSSGKMRKK